MEVEKIDGKMELVEITSQLMPKGIPKFLDVVKYPKIENLLPELGKSKMLKVLFLMIKDFCNSINVVRNMNEDQMIEGAAMLLDECRNFRLEDYVMMFSMAKRGDLVDIRDRIDIQMLSQMMDHYWNRRNVAAESVISGELNHLESLGNTSKQIENFHPQDARLIKSLDKITAAFEGWKEIVKPELQSQ